MSDQKYTLNYTGLEINTILANSESHVKDTNMHITEEDKVKLDIQSD